MSAPMIVTTPPAGFARLRFVTDASDLLAAAIRFDTMTKVASHVEAVTPSGIIGAYGDGVALKPLNYDTGSTAQTYVDIAMPSEMYGRWLYALNAEIGAPYDYEAIAGFAAHMDLHEKGAVICSALQALCLRRCAFFAHPLAKPAHEIAPADLLLMLSGNPFATVRPLETRAAA